MDIVIEKARPGDADAIFGLLAQDALPTDGLRERLETTVVARRNGEVVGVAALEVYRTCPASATVMRAAL